MLTWPFGQIFHDITPRLQNENSKIERKVHEPQDSQMRHDFWRSFHMGLKNGQSRQAPSVQATREHCL
jgi:hypothetical protein